MPTWGEIGKEIAEIVKKKDPAAFDIVRRKYLGMLYKKTERSTILYASAWCQKSGTSPANVSIVEEDIQGFMEVIHKLKGPSLDLILHSPGGSPETTEAIVSYLRSHFDDIRVIIPQSAMSAATMMACAADRIVMGKHSFIGPIDPQFALQTQLGYRSIPAQAIKDQFEYAIEECADTRKLGAWLPILSQYGPALYKQCDNALELSKELVSTWLRTYMFRSRPDASEIAERIADTLRDHTRFKTHDRHLDRQTAESLGLVVDHLESDDEFQDLVLSVYHAVAHTFTGTPAVKLIENHLGKAFIKLEKSLVVEQRVQGPQSPGFVRPPGFPPD